MKTLPKELKKQHAELASQIAAARQEVESAVQTFNDALDAAEEFCTEQAAAAIQEWMDDRSEKWQESDAAADVQSWLDEWENVDLTRLDDIFEFEGQDEFSNLPLTRE